MRVESMALAAFLASSVAALAADPTLPGPAVVVPDRSGGFYVGIGGGLNLLEEQSIPSVGSPFGPQPGGYIKSEPEGVLLGSLGWAFGNGLRVEVEGSFRRNRFERATAGALVDERAGGRQETTAIFANAFYDVDLTAFGLNTSISPYFGAGIGYASAKWKNVYVTKPGEFVRHNDTDEGVALQGIVGVAAPITAAPGLAITLEYRVMGFVDDRQYKGRVEQSPIGAFPITTNIEDGLNHGVLVGVRYAFGS